MSKVIERNSDWNIEQSIAAPASPEWKQALEAEKAKRVAAGTWKPKASAPAPAAPPAP